MKVNLYNQKITNDRPLYHDTLGPMFGVQIEKVRFVDTVQRECLITVECPSKPALDNALAFLRSQDVTVQVVPDRHLPAGRNPSNTLQTLPAIAKQFNQHKYDVLSNAELNIIYHLAISPTFFTIGSAIDSDKPFLRALEQHGIFLNHWDTTSSGRNRWSLALPTGHSLDRFDAVASAHGLKCETAWRYNALWERAESALWSRVLATIKPQAYGASHADLEDAFQDSLVRLHMLFLEAWNKGIAGNGIDQYALAGAVGNFRTIVMNRLIDRARRARRITLQAEVREDDLEPDEAESIVSLDRRYTLIAHLKRWFTSLSPDKRKMLELSISGFPAARIAATLGSTEGAINTRVCRLYSQIRHNLKISGLINEPWVRGQFFDALQEILTTNQQNNQ